MRCGADVIVSNAAVHGRSPRAAYMPDATRAVPGISRVDPRGRVTPLVLTSSNTVIVAIAAVPDVLAVLLLLAASYSSRSEPAPAAPVIVEDKPATSRQARSRAARKGWTTRKRKAMVAAAGKPVMQVK
jgi:hypothetical protein